MLSAHVSVYAFFGYTLIPRLGAAEVGLGFSSKRSKSCQFCPMFLEVVVVTASILRDTDSPKALLMTNETIRKIAYLMVGRIQDKLLFRLYKTISWRELFVSHFQWTTQYNELHC